MKTELLKNLEKIESRNSDEDINWKTSPTKKLVQEMKKTKKFKQCKGNNWWKGSWRKLKQQCKIVTKEMKKKIGKAAYHQNWIKKCKVLEAQMVKAKLFKNQTTWIMKIKL